MTFSEETSSTAVRRALAILEAVAARETGLTNSEISRKLAIPKSSASYILRTLETSGYLRRAPGTGKYMLGLKVLGLSRGVQAGTDVREAAAAALRRLVDRTDLTAHLAILDRGEAVYVEKVEPQTFVKMDTWVGRRMAVNATGVGKALVAYLPDAEMDAVLRERGFVRRTLKTITSRSKFLRELEKVRERGYAVDDEENSLGARCVAAPVFDGSGRAIAAIGLTGTTTQIDKASVAKIADLVKEAARKVSHHFGYREDLKRPRS